MRKQYTVSTPVVGVPVALRKKSRFPESLNCLKCGQAFKPHKDRTRFCSRACYEQWAHAKAVESRPHTKRGRRILRLEAVATQAAPKDLGNEYANRCEFWLAEVETELASRLKSNGWRPTREPLILTGHGISLRIESGALHVRDGLTHYPQECREYRFFPGKHNTPSRIVLLGHDGSISIDVLCWLAGQRIPLVILDFQGNEITCISSTPTADDSKLRLAQLLATRPDRALEIAQQFVRSKLAGQLANVIELWPDTDLRRKSEQKIGSCLELIESANSTGELLTIEAAAANSYFKLWKELPLNWSKKSIGRIPDEWRTFGQRESKVGGENRNASHPVNAILNYGYAVLESQVRIACAIIGLDAGISYLHAAKDGRDSLVFDLIEPLRVELESHLIRFILGATFGHEDFVLSVQGICRVSPQLGRRIATLGAMGDRAQYVAVRLRDLVLQESGAAR